MDQNKAEEPTHPRLVKMLTDKNGARLEAPVLVDPLGIDPLIHL